MSVDSDRQATCNFRSSCGLLMCAMFMLPVSAMGQVFVVDPQRAGSVDRYAGLPERFRAVPFCGDLRLDGSVVIPNVKNGCIVTDPAPRELLRALKDRETVR